MRIGLDIHGVLDHHPEKYIELAKCVRAGAPANRVYVITGPSKEKAREELLVLSKGFIFWDEIYSIVDYIKEHNIPHTTTKDGKVWTLVNEDWNKVKGLLCEELKLDLHIDDSVEYEQYFPAGANPPYGGGTGGIDRCFTCNRNI